MKRVLFVLFALIISYSCISFFSACSNSEISIKYIDSKLYARYDSGVPGSGYGYTNSYMPYDGVISFEEYEKVSERCVSRSNYYVRFNLTFNSTPKGYKAIDVYKLNYITLDNLSDKNRSMARREGKTNKEIEILIYLRNYTASETEHTVKSLTYTMFDSTIGEDVQKTIELNYKFNIIKDFNFFNRFDNDSKFDIISIECTRSILEFTVESNIDYDKILYQVDKKGRQQFSYQYVSLVNEATMDKEETYIYESDINEYSYYVYFEIVGYQKNNINYYTYPMGFAMMDS